jgi:hypothetical protein
MERIGDLLIDVGAVYHILTQAAHAVGGRDARSSEFYLEEALRRIEEVEREWGVDLGGPKGAIRSAIQGVRDRAWSVAMDNLTTVAGGLHHALIHEFARRLGQGFKGGAPK